MGPAVNKKKVLVVSKSLLAGGIEKACLNFIQQLKNDVDIELFLCNNSGKLKSEVPSDIPVIEANKLVRYFTRTNFENNSIKDKRSRIKLAIKKFIKFFYVNCGIKSLLQKLAILFQKKIIKEYDCVVSFYAQDFLASKLAIKKTKSKNKLAFIHADVTQYSLNKKAVRLLKYYDKVICVSKSCAEIFKQKFPKLANKVDFIYNFQNTQSIIDNSLKFNISYPQTFNIVSVSRLGAEKGIERSLKVFRRLHNEGYKFNWHIIGDGAEREKIENFILNQGMQNYVKLYGNQANPYPYIKEADILYLGSHHESWGMVLVEAMTLGIPVLTTETSSTYELLDGKGYVCTNSEEGIYLAWKAIFNNKKLFKVKKDEIKNYKFNNQANKCKFLDLI